LAVDHAQPASIMQFGCVVIFERGQGALQFERSAARKLRHFSNFPAAPRRAERAQETPRGWPVAPAPQGVNVRFAPLCGLKSDISRGPRSVPNLVQSKAKQDQ